MVTPIFDEPTNSLQDWSYGSKAAPRGARLALISQSPALLHELAGDVETAGYDVAAKRGHDELATVSQRVTFDALYLDCQHLDFANLDDLAACIAAAKSKGAGVIVSVTSANLDDVFAACGSEQVDILVSPSRAERLLAVARAVAGVTGQRVQELSEGDRLVLLRLTEQITEISGRLDRLQGAEGALGSHSANPDARDGNDPLRRHSAEGNNQGIVSRELPKVDPKFIRKIIRLRQMRARYFDVDLFADPAWDMLLDLAAARFEQNKVSVTSLCIASGVPPTTALRWIGQMTEAGLLQRVEDVTDRRRAFITLTDKAFQGMASYLVAIGGSSIVV